VSVAAYRPGTQAITVVDDDQMTHLYASGWITLAEHQANEAAAADAAAQASKTAPSGKDK